MITACPEKSKQKIYQCGDCKYWDTDCPNYVKEETMKCPKCGKESNEIKSPLCKECYEIAYCKPNPSPRDIFQHIKTEYEKKAFSEFMLYQQRYNCCWDEPLTDHRLDEIKKQHPDQYRWLQDKGLIPKKPVKRVMTGTALWEINKEGIVYPKEWLNTGIEYPFSNLAGKRGKLTFEYEVEEQ